MRGIIFEAAGRIRLVDDLPIPEPEEGEVLVRCTQMGLCGSNMAPYLRSGRWAQMPSPAPVGWTGHENVGVIAQSRNPSWAEGTKVLAQSRDFNGFTEYIAAEPEALARLPEGADDLGPYVIAQPLATVLRALSKTEPVVNERCAVVGQGPMGLLFTYMLKRMGASQVIGIDLIPWRLEWSRRMGATDVIDASAQDPVAAVQQLTGGAMVDYCCEATDSAEALATAAHLLRSGGRLCPFGVPRHKSQEFPWVVGVLNELRFVVSHGQGCLQFFQTAVDMVAGDGRVLQDLVTPRMAWQEAARAFEMYAHPESHAGSLKLVLDL